MSTMVITLIGLSGCGKSHFARRLVEERGFGYRGCDDLIEKRLGQLPKTKHLAGIQDVADWLGQPFQPTYAEREQCYLDLEREVVQEILDEVGPEGWDVNEDLVIDTTGSVIYLGEQLMSELKKRSRIIYFAIPENEYEFMFEQYFSDPKPVIWGQSFAPQEGETDQQTLQRCYPELIYWRAERYRKFAEMMMVMDRENRDRLSVARFLQLAGAK